MVFDIIRNRRSIFPWQYIDKPIKKNDLDKILEAANWAPTHKKTEPWRFKVMQGNSKKKIRHISFGKVSGNRKSTKTD